MMLISVQRAPVLMGKLESLQVRLICRNEWLSRNVNAIVVHGSKLKDKLVSRGYFLYN
jgi:hypothetical protein